MSDVVVRQAAPGWRVLLRDVVGASALTPLALASLLSLLSATIATPGRGVHFAEHAQAWALLASVGTGLVYLLSTRFRALSVLRASAATLASRALRRCYGAALAVTAISYAAAVGFAIGLLARGGLVFSVGVDLADLVMGLAAIVGLMVAAPSETEAPAR